MKPKWQTLDSLGPGNMHTLVSVLLCSFCFQRIPFDTIFDFTTACDWDYGAAVECLPVLHYSVDFILFSFGIIDFIVELLNYLY